MKVTVETGHRRSFGVAIKRSSTGTTLVDSTYGPIVISPDYVEMTVSVPSTTIFGLGSAGDRRTAFARSFASYTKLAVHNRPGAEGFHPFFVGADPANSMFHGVYWDNPYPLEVQLSPAPAVTFRAMGGNAVIHLLSGPTPGDVSYQLMRDLVGPVIERVPDESPSPPLIQHSRSGGNAAVLVARIPPVHRIAVVLFYSIVLIHEYT